MGDASSVSAKSIGCKPDFIRLSCGLTVVAMIGCRLFWML
jgi:hypothetical protein